MQAVGLNPQVAFRAGNTKDAEKPKTQVNTKTEPMENDTYETPKHKKTFKEKLGSIAKFFVSLKEMAVGIFKGVVLGGLSATVILVGDRLINAKPTPTLKGGMAAGIIGTGIAAYHIIKARLKSNQRTANVDHQLHIGHRDK